MVRFFNKKPAARKDTRAKGAETPSPPAKAAVAPPGPPATRTPRTASSAAAVTTADATKKPVSRVRRAPAGRPPRRDWAAEAAAAPIDAPAPAPASLAASPSEDADHGDVAGAPAKRRRGTRGGRGRKKPGVSENGSAPVAALPTPITRQPARKPAQPQTLEDIVARQADVLEAFARDVTITLRDVQATVGDLQSQLAQRQNTHVSQERVGIFVDVPNVIYAAERRNINLDFGRVLEYFTRGRQLVRASAYSPISDDPQAKLESQRFVHHFVGHPYRIITKPLKRFADGSMKANFDIELAIDILTMSDRLDVVVLMSGDGDFRRLVEMISSRGVRVEVAAFSETASSELKSAADLYIDIGAHLEEFRAAK